MRTAYPVVFTELPDGYMAYVPDMQINTQGDTLAEAIAMSRDAIGIMGIDMEDDKKPLPVPSRLSAIAKQYPNDVVTFVDIDFTEYRRRNSSTVRRNVSLPSWLNYEAEKANINVSAFLQEALREHLHL